MSVFDVCPLRLFKMNLSIEIYFGFLSVYFQKQIFFAYVFCIFRSYTLKVNVQMSIIGNILFQ